MFFLRSRSPERDCPRGLRVVALFVFGLLIAFAGIIAFLISDELSRASQSRDLLNRSFETRSQMQSVFSLLQDAETGQRGFIITGDEAFLEPYASAVRQIPEQMQRLGEFLIGYPEQLQRLKRLQDLAQSKLQEMTRGIDARREQRASEAMEIVSSGRGKALMDEIRVVVGAMIESEAAAVAAQVEDSQDRSSRASSLMMAAILASLVVVLIASYLVFRHLERRLRAERAMRRQEQLIGIMRAVAEGANLAADLDEAVKSTFRSLGTGFKVSKGIAVRSHPTSGTASAIARQPEDTGDDELDSHVADLASRPDLSIEIKGSTDHPEGIQRLVIPVLDQGRPVAALLLQGLEHTVERDALLAVAQYTAIQLSRAAERDRILHVLRDTLARHEAIFQSAIDGIVTLNASGSIESFNPAAERLFGLKAADILRRHFSILMEATPETIGRLSALMREDSRGDGAVRELTGRCADGSTFPADVATNVMHLGNRRLFLAIIRDASERKRIEQMKNEFVSTVSHELRTPLTSIAGSLGLLAGGAAGALPDRAGKLIGIAHANSQRLVRLINDILDIEKIESGRMPFDLKLVSLAALIRQTVEANRGFAESYGVQIVQAEHSVDGTVLADPDRLAQVLTNLLSNAIKYSPRGEAVEVLVTERDSRYRLTVRDRGPGIPEEFRPRMFTKFAQADSTDTRQKGGTGLGLSIVKEIVSRLGGSVSYDTASDWGTAFHVDLPGHREVDPPIRKGDAKPTVLVCQASADAALALEETLAGAGFACDRAESAASAKSLAASKSYAAILVDLSLPDQDGISLIRDLRSSVRSGGAPILVVSTDPSAGPGQMVSRTLPVLDWLQKPVDPDRLVRAVKDALERSVQDRPRILHVDDDPDVLQVVAAAFGGRACLHSVETLEGAHTALNERSFDLVILDLGLAEGSGLELLPRLQRTDGRATPVVVFSAQDADPDVARKVDAILTKSRATLEGLVETVDSLIRRTDSEKNQADQVQ